MLMIIQYCCHGALNRLLQNNPDVPLDDLFLYLQGTANGMSYLASKHFCHRDLAARNVLVDAAYRPKIADFGLSRDLEESDYYQSNVNATLPLRWCAPEVLLNRKFGEASDVWSFGVLIDEVYNRGAFPYPGWTNALVQINVAAGYTLPQAQGCPDLLYQEIMKLCLHIDAQERPSFHEICTAFDQLPTRNTIGFWRKCSVKQNKAKDALEPEEPYYLQPTPLRVGDRSYDNADLRTPAAPAVEGEGDDSGDSDASDATTWSTFKWVDGVPMTHGQHEQFRCLRDVGKASMLRDMKLAMKATTIVDASNRPVPPGISTTLASDAELPYVEFGASDEAPTTVLGLNGTSPATPAASPTAPETASGQAEYNKRMSTFMQPVMINLPELGDDDYIVESFPRRDAAKLIDAKLVGGIYEDDDGESPYAPPDFTPKSSDVTQPARAPSVESESLYAPPDFTVV